MPRKSSSSARRTAGDTADNPLLLDAYGRQVDESGRRIGHGGRSINYPSMIRQDTPRWRDRRDRPNTTLPSATNVGAPSPLVAAARAPSPQAAATTVAARVEDADIVQEARPAGRRWPDGGLVAPRLRSMMRRHRQEAAGQEAADREKRLYLTDVRPPEIPEGVVVKEQHECTDADIRIATYVCIRQALERSMRCPSCMTPMAEPPFRHWGEEKGIRADYPTVVDQSEVNYSFEGLVFLRK
ncbi:hypothetical protein C8R47DRAFT_1228808 [Mycena vitilis]|nr:hypothetical protein C8R47DRAFT_1228808 [Mycena vitilis]